MTQQHNERYPDTTVPTTIPLPAPPQTAEQTVQYLNVLHQFLNSQQARYSEIFRLLSYHRTTVSTEADTPASGGTGSTSPQANVPDSLPDAVGGGTMSATVDADGVGRLFVDVPTEGTPEWVEIAKGASSLAEDPNGIPASEVSKVTLDYDDVTRKFTIDGTFTYLYKGTEVNFVGPRSITHADTTGLWHFYFDEDGTLIADDTVTFFDIIRDNVYLANLYWNSSHAESVLRGDELHGLMPWESHILQHEFEGGTSYGSGLTLGSVLTDQSGDLDAHAEFSVASGTFVDEDRYHSYAGKTSTASFDTWAKEGASGDWYVAGTSSAPVIVSGGVPYVNEYTGGVWTQTIVPNNDYFLAHIIAVNDWRATGEKLVAVQGENIYGTKRQARDGALVEMDSLTLNGLPAQEFVKVATLICQYRSGQTNSWATRFVSTDAGDDYVNWLVNLGSPGAAPSSHPNTTNRDDPDQHPDTSISVDSAAFGGFLTGIDDVHDAIELTDRIADDDVILSGTHTGNLSAGTHLDDVSTFVDDLDMDLYLKADGTTELTADWDVGGYNIQSVGTIDAAEGLFTILSPTESASFTSGVVKELFRFYADADEGNQVFLQYDITAIDGTDVQHAGGVYLANFCRENDGTPHAASPVKLGETNTVSTGTITVAAATNTAGTTHGRFRFTITCTGITPTSIVGRFSVSGGAGKTFTWSI